jgi:TPR repeat protein
MPATTGKRRALQSFMNSYTRSGLVTIALGVALATLASATALSSHPVAIAVRHCDCVAAVKLVNPRVASNDDQTAFLAGRMLDEGICVQKDAVAAADFFARAADLGDKNAALEYATKVGLGIGAEQSYAHAGDLCRVTGLDPQTLMSRYSLGYACTVSGVAAALLREKLPRAAFSGNPAVVIVDFSPASAQMHIRATPHVRLGDAPLGSSLRRPVMDAQQEVEKAWRDALAAVPKPDATQLDGQVVQLALDVDTTLEDGRDVSRPNRQEFRPILPGEYLREQR